MAAYEPIGDAFGGAAYGEKNDPVSAAFSLYGMFTAGEALAAGFSIMQGLTFAGSALSLVGNITGNKDLMKIGAVVGLAGFAGTMLGNSVSLAPTGTDVGATPSPATTLSQTPNNPVDALQSPTGTELPVGSNINGTVTTPVGNAPMVDVNAPGAGGGINAGPGATNFNAPNGSPIGNMGAANWRVPACPAVAESGDLN